MLALQRSVGRHHATVVGVGPHRATGGKVGAALGCAAPDKELGEVIGTGGCHVEHLRLPGANLAAAAPVEQHAPLGLFGVLVPEVLVIALGRWRCIFRRLQLQGRTQESLRHCLLCFFEIRVGAAANGDIHPAPGAHAARVAETIRAEARLATEHAAEGAHRIAAHRHTHAGKCRDVDPGLRLGRRRALRGNGRRDGEKSREEGRGHYMNGIWYWLHGASSLICRRNDTPGGPIAADVRAYRFAWTRSTVLVNTSSSISRALPKSNTASS